MLDCPFWKVTEMLWGFRRCSMILQALRLRHTDPFMVSFEGFNVWTHLSLSLLQLHISEELCTLYGQEHHGRMASINQGFSNAIRLVLVAHTLTYLYFCPSLVSLSPSQHFACCFVRAWQQITAAPTCEMQGDVSTERLGSDVNLTPVVTSTYSISQHLLCKHCQLPSSRIHEKQLFSKWCGFVTFERKYRSNIK